MNITNRAQKVNEKNGVICLVFLFPCWLIVLILPRIVSLSQFFADISKNYKAVIAIYVYASESSCFALSENAMK